MSEHSDPLRTAPENEGRSASESALPLPTHIGRYRVERILGEGGFGIVYLAHDDQLQRPVAVKVPHTRLVSRPEDAEAYLTEARTVAKLDHSHIVPVHDVGSTEMFPFFVVSKYIDGTDLAKRLKQARLSIDQTVELVATVAEALHFAHKQGFVHRDIKPGNILLDKSDKPFVADFGLALREEDVGKGPRYAGTPAYMSPEQARGEGHRVDGRSDIFSLGVVYYQLLTGRQPFHADTRHELLERIANMEVRPPRQWEDAIPKELERICLKSLSNRASERYTTANDLADDLRHFLNLQPSQTTTTHDADFFLEEELNKIDREWHSERDRYLMMSEFGGKKTPSKRRGVIAGIVLVGIAIGLHFMFQSLKAGLIRELGPYISGIVLCFGIGLGWLQYSKGLHYERAHAAYLARRSAVSAKYKL